MTSTILPIGVCVLPERPESIARTGLFPHYIHEILAHAGLGYETVAPDELEARLPQLRVLVTVGEADLGEKTAALQFWVEQGGAWLSLGGLCGCQSLWAAEYAQPSYQSKWATTTACTLGEGYLSPAASGHPALSHLEIPLHFYNGIAIQPLADQAATVLATVLDAHGRATDRIGILERHVGSGHCLLLAVDAIGAVQYIQQGIAVTRDGISAPDGTAPVTDGVLKSDDGMVLDWYFDRQQVPGVPGLQGFLQPVADHWREVILRSIFYLAQNTATPVHLLWLYPRNLPAIAHMSHDTDGNIPERGQRLLELLAEAEIHTTWCVILPGYEKELIRAISDAGHELAMHYDAMSMDCPWSQALFDSQWTQLTEIFGEAPVSNKNHYTRWEGDTEFFEWCLKRGIQLDQSKGASKPGECGFNFGTCHPYFPLAPDGTRLDVLELPTPTQDLEIFAPLEVGKALLAAAIRHHGVLHVLFHPAHTHKPEVGVALLEIAAAAKDQGLEWWTAKRLNAWERARRQLRWSAIESASGKYEVALRIEESLPEATLCFLRNSAKSIEVGSEVRETNLTTRWGFEFEAVVVNLESDTKYSLSWSD